MSTIEHVTLTVTATGTAGSASGTAVSPVFTGGARILRVWYDYHASTPATADVTLYDTALGATLGLIDGKANSATDAVRYPRISDFHDTSGASLSANEQTECYHIPAGGTITCALAQGDALTGAVICYVLVERFGA